MTPARAFVISFFGLLSLFLHISLAAEPNCDFPVLDIPAQKIDVLGDWEKGQLCKLPRPNSMCSRVGPADRACKNVARATRNARNVTCSHPHTCSFWVKHPIQHRHTPGFAFVSLCVPDFSGVIFPCRENNLVVSNPFYRNVYPEVDPTAPPLYNPSDDLSDIASNPLCEFPPLDFEPKGDVLGDREKGNVCSLPRPANLCPRGKGPADEWCKKIARAVGGTSDAACFRKGACSFTVKKPILHPTKPGTAYVSLCVPSYAGVIFPCRENNLVVIDPFYNPIDEDDPDVIEPTNDKPTWDENSLAIPSNCSNPTGAPELAEDKTKLFGKYIAYKLAAIDPIQSRIAERLVSEVLFQAEMGYLNKHFALVETVPKSRQELEEKQHRFDASPLNLQSLQPRELQNTSTISSHI